MFVVNFVIVVDGNDVAVQLLSSAGTFAVVSMGQKPMQFASMQSAMESFLAILPVIGWPVKSVSVEPAMAP